MSKKKRPILFIVESPTKIKTLTKILKGQNFKFIATFGHIKDLPAQTLGVDLKTLEPFFSVLEPKRKIIKRIKETLREVREVYLATDPDREGEAISFHLYEILKGPKENSLNFHRIELYEITELGIKSALKNLKKLDENLYSAWKARRVADRLIGYLSSPFLSKHFKKPLSAGRVQSPALKLVVEREKEIENFLPKTDYSLSLLAQTEKGESLEFELFSKNKLVKKENKQELLEIYENYFKNCWLYVFKIQEKEIKKYPPYPFKTSTLIEFAGKTLGFSPKETMFLAQKLYEEGYITYMRTDSIRISPLAQKKAKEYIEKHFGKAFLGSTRKAKSSLFIQDAHECIRPTDLNIKTLSLGKKEQLLYNLIKTYFLASQMSPALFLEKNYVLRSQRSPKNFSLQRKENKLLFEGYLILFEKEKEEVSLWTDLKERENLKVIDFKIKEHKTKPPERYTPEGLIKKLESLGIGRPSTYATLFDILFTRGYIEKEGRYIKPTELGKRVCEFLEKNWPPFMDYNFTAKLELALDEIAKNKKEYYSTVKEILSILQRYLSL